MTQAPVSPNIDAPRIKNGQSVDTLTQNGLTVYQFCSSTETLRDEDSSRLEQLRIQAESNIALMKAFLGDKVNDAVYAAATVYPLLREALTNDKITHDAVVGDLVRLAPADKRHYLRGLCLDANDIFDKEQSLHVDGAPETAEGWIDLQSSPLSFDDLDELANNVNLESLAITAIDILNRLNEAAPADEDTYRAIHISEKLYVPLCEIVGLDGLAMELRSRANILRLKHSGNYHFVQEAHQILGEHGFPQHMEAFEFAEAMLADIGIENIGEHAVSVTNDHNTIIGHGLAELLSDDEEPTIFRYVFRGKSIGSLAMKLFKQSDKGSAERGAPMDLFGVTLITDNRDPVGRIARTISDKIQDNTPGNLYFKNTPSRSQSTVIYGDDEYKQAIFASTGWNPDTTDSAVREGSNLEVTKVTFVRGASYIEVQLLTEDERHRSRISSDNAHVIFKYERLSGKKMTPEERYRAGEIIARLHGRRDNMRIAMLSEQSEQKLARHQRRQTGSRVASITVSL